MSTRKLTIGMATFEDFDGVWFSISSIRLHHPEILKEVEFLILDNNPESAHGKANKDFCNWLKEPVRYVPITDTYGTGIRSRIFDLAQTPYVLCMDSHVLLAPGSLRKLIDYMDRKDQGDLLQGPMLYDSLIPAASHMACHWRDRMWGIWAMAWRCKCGNLMQAVEDEKNIRWETLAFPHQPLTECPCGKKLPESAWHGHEKACRKHGLKYAISGQPFEIPAHGLGVFACRKDAWVGFNPQFRGFGGEEVYIHIKTRMSGHRTLCLPFLKWLHRFRRPSGIQYPLGYEERIRNYMIGHIELGLSMDEMIEHFSKSIGKEAVLKVVQ